MTDYGPSRILIGNTEPAVHLGWNGIPFMMDEQFGKHLEFAYIFGTAIPSVYPTSPVIADKSTGDHSWNTRHANNFSGIPNTRSFTANANAYYVTTFTGQDFFAINNEFTLVSIANYSNTGGNHVIGDNNGPALNGIGLGVHLTGGINYNFAAWYASLTDTFLALNTSTWIGTGLEFVTAAVYSNLTATLYNPNPLNHTLNSNTATLPGNPGGANLMRVGRSVATNFTSPTEIAAVFGFSKAFNANEVTALHANLQTFFASYGITVLNI